MYVCRETSTCSPTRTLTMWSALRGHGKHYTHTQHTWYTHNTQHTHTYTHTHTHTQHTHTQTHTRHSRTRKHKVRKDRKTNFGILPSQRDGPMFPSGVHLHVCIYAHTNAHAEMKKRFVWFTISERRSRQQLLGEKKEDPQYTEDLSHSPSQRDGHIRKKKSSPLVLVICPNHHLRESVVGRTPGSG